VDVCKHSRDTCPACNNEADKWAAALRELVPIARRIWKTRMPEHERNAGLEKLVDIAESALLGKERT
jgi:hypothetical protein